MRGHQRRLGMACHVPEAGFVKVRKVDHDIQRIATPDEGKPVIGQAIADIWRRREPKRHPFAEDRRAAPDRADRAQAGRMQHIEHVQVGVDRFGAFNMKDRRQLSLLEGRSYVGHAFAYVKGPEAFELAQNGNLRGHHRQCVATIDRLWQRKVIRVLRHFLELQIRIAWRRHENRKEPTTEAACPALVQVDSAITSFQEGVGPCHPARAIELQKDIVMAIKNQWAETGHVLDLSNFDECSKEKGIQRRKVYELKSYLYTSGMIRMSKTRNWHSIPEYNAFRAVMLAGTTTAAGHQLGLSQSAISRSIANLEAKIGDILFERDAGRLIPTQAAVRLNRRLDPLFDALRRIDGPTEPVRETLRLIAPPTYSHRFMVSLISSFLKMNPEFFVSFEVNTSDEVTRGVLEDRFDLGVIGVEIKRADLKLLPYRKSMAVCVMAPDHPLANRTEILPADLHGVDMVALSFRHERRGQLDRLLHQSRSEPHLVAEVSTSFAAADLAKEKVGLAVINPFPLYHYRSDDLAFVPFRSPILYQSYFVTSNARPVPRIARAFMRHLRLHAPTDPFSEKA